MLGIDLRKKRLENLSTETDIKVALAQARYESNAARIAAQMSDIFKGREESSWKNSPIYYNIEELLKGILGSVGSIAGPLYLGSKVGAVKKIGKAAGG